MNEKKNSPIGFVLDPFGRPVSAAAWDAAWKEQEKRGQSFNNAMTWLKGVFEDLLKTDEGRLIAFDEDGVIEVVTTREEAMALSYKLLAEKRAKPWLIRPVTRDEDPRGR